MSCDAHAEMLAAFPYRPYEIQQQLMINIYEALENNQIGLFESPTGTGKTLSVICSTLTWLEDERLKQEQEAASKSSGEGADLPDWMRSFSNSTPAPHLQPSQRAVQATAHQQQYKITQATKQHKQQQPQVLDENGQDLSEFLVNADAAAGLPSGSKRSAKQSGYIIISSSSEDDTEAAADADAAGATAAAAAEAAPPKRPQIIFCSRTHSQLSQFVGELHRTRFADSIMLVAVGSRKNLCVNDDVLRLQEPSQINERCLDLQRSKAASNKPGRKAAAVNPRPADNTTNSQGVVGFMQQQQQQHASGHPGGSKPSKQRRRPHQQQSGCPFLSVEGGPAGWAEFTDLLLAAPIDVEELAHLGRRKKVCAYYGSRRAVPVADVVLAPYSAVLLPAARDSLGIQLAGSVLVFDEAHNLLDAVNGAHSAAVSAWQLLSVQRSITAYYERFKVFLNPANAQNLQLLLRIAAALHSCLTQQQQQRPQQGPHMSAAAAAAAAAGRVVAVNDLLFDTGLDNVNMLQLAQWVKDTKLAFKVAGYAAVAVEQAGGKVELQQTHQASASAAAAADSSPAGAGLDDHQAVHGTTAAAVQQQQQQQLGHLSARDGVSAIHSFISFLCSLTNPDTDGRVIIEPAAAAVGGTEASSSSSSSGVLPPPPSTAAAAAAGRCGRLRYVLLNAASHFGRLLSAARSVLLISGTLAPVAGLQAALFPALPPQRLRHFECGHVVPAKQLLALCIGAGPSGKTLNLRHESRSDQCLVDEVGQLLLNVAGVVPEGCVVFAPSFTYLELLLARWQATGLLGRLQTRKHVFREPRSATDVEQVLTAYAAAAAAANSNSRDHGQQPTHAAAAAAGGAVQQPNSSVCGGVSSSSCSGAVLLCVVGGKLSEGINFGDGLGRCVVMLGMPYPNPAEPELRERMAYLDKQAAAAAAAGMASAQPTHAAQQQDLLQLPLHPPDQQQQQQPQQPGVQHRSVFQVVHGGPHMQTGTAPRETGQAQGAAQAAIQAASGAAAAQPPTASSTIQTPPDLHQQQQQQPPQQQHPLGGRDYYDDLCFKAVNQCVGRVVRHKNDYAAILMVDSRWVVSHTEWAAIRQQQQQGSSRSSSSSSSRQLPVQKLPGWVQRSFVPTNGQFGPAYKELAQFFTRQQQQQLKQTVAQREEQQQ